MIDDIIEQAIQSDSLDKALAILEPLVSDGDPRVQYLYAMWVMEYDFHSSVELLLTSAKQGYPDAIDQLQNGVLKNSSRRLKADQKRKITHTINSMMRHAEFVIETFEESFQNKLGRKAYRRGVNNREEWFLTDPVFSYIQHAKPGNVGSRVGYNLSLDNWCGMFGHITFYMVHSPIMASIFKGNIDSDIILSALESTKRYRFEQYMTWDSRMARDSSSANGKSPDTISSYEMNRFKRKFDEIKDGFVADLFPKLPNRGKALSGDKAHVAGNTFYLRLSDKLFLLGKQQIDDLIDKSWPLFSCLYPDGALAKRIAGLARNLRISKIEKRCEINKIRNLPTEIKKHECAGRLEGAHIIPHKLNGSDKLGNGLWLCNYHHRRTEGKIKGKRGNVEYKS